MTLAAINWLHISINLLLVIHVIVSLLLVLLILMQRPKQEGLGAAFGAGMTDQMFGARTTNVLQKGTVYLGTAFFALTLVLAILIAKRNRVESLVGKSVPAAEEAAVPPAPDKSLQDELEKVKKEGEQAAKDKEAAATKDANSTPVPEPAPAPAPAPTPEPTPTPTPAPGDGAVVPPATPPAAGAPAADEGQNK